MTNDVTEALRRLQGGLARAIGPWAEQRHEEALDIILRHPGKTGNPDYLTRNALADASRKLKERAELIGANAASIDVVAESSLSRFEEDAPYTYDELLIDLVDLVRRGLRSADAALLMLAMISGAEGAEVATTFGISEDAARQRLSRARRRAKTAWRELN